jgi:large subunit ribosomal protein L13
MDMGDYVIVVNAEKVAVTGNKETDKVYYRHSGYPGGLRADTLAEMRSTYPDRLIESAVKGMIPKNKLGRQTLTKLKVYAGPDHPHAAQHPQSLTLTQGKAEA